MAIPDFSINMDANHVYGFPFQFNDASQGAHSWKWDFGDGAVSNEQNTTHRFSEIQQYYITLTVSNVDGCESDTTKPLFVSPIYVPNAFTPNGDGKNDTFYTAGYESGPFEMDAFNYEMLIFNRWGQLVFKSKSASISWDGKTVEGKNAPSGVYIYKLEITGKNDDNQPSKKTKLIGTVTLIR
ncbi:MAG: gliding motility-associated C-terminal domain-containing protein [Bacteroidetes bacterium]|nr:gliding motility-associated C-terminal domain-containing protein [Bacteroidota bacterium]